MTSSLNMTKQALASLKNEKVKRTTPLKIICKELDFPEKEKVNRASEQTILKQKLSFQKTEKGDKVSTLMTAHKSFFDLLAQTQRLISANKELVFRGSDKRKHPYELITANKAVCLQNRENEKSCEEFSITNKELHFQNTETEKYTDELTIINEKLIQSEAALNKLNVRLEEIVKETIIANQDRENALNRISDDVRSLDNDWRYTFLNTTALTTLPPGQETAIGSIIWDVYPELIGTIFWDKFHEGMLTKKVVEFESLYAPMNNWLSVKIYPSPDGLTIFTKDITKRKLADQQLEQSLKEASDYKYALEESCIISFNDPQGIITYVNDNFCNITKYSREEIVGNDYSLLDAGYQSKEYIRGIWTALADGKIWRGEFKNRAKDATDFWVATTIIPFLNKEGTPYKYLTIRSNITERKLAEERILKMNEELEEKISARTLELTESLMKEKVLNEMKSRFVSLASHEFRTPLSTILSSVSLIACYNDENQQEKRTKHINRITTSVKDLTGILNDFLSLDMLEHGKIERKTEFFDLSEFVSEILDEVNFMLKEGQHINYVYNGEKELQQDKKVIKNIFLNLLSNAIKYSGEHKRIQVSIEVHNRQVSMEVKDEGIGIPEEEQKYLFQKFYRSKNAIHIQGTGLGLTIVKKYVELLGGTIDFKSIFNQGTIFTVEFPQYLS